MTRPMSALLGGAFGAELTEDEAALRVFLSAGGLVVLGVALLCMTVWWWRSTRPEPPALGPLEVMSDRKWAAAGDSERRRLVDIHRPDGAATNDLVVAPPIDLSVLARGVPNFDDLQDVSLDRLGRPLLADPEALEAGRSAAGEVELEASSAGEPPDDAAPVAFVGSAGDAADATSAPGQSAGSAEQGSLAAGIADAEFDELARSANDDPIEFDDADMAPVGARAAVGTVGASATSGSVHRLDTDLDGGGDAGDDVESDGGTGHTPGIDADARLDPDDGAYDATVAQPRPHDVGHGAGRD